MIAHIVFLRAHDATPPDERRAILGTVRKAMKNFPTVRAYRIGTRVRHGLPGYEQAMREDYEYALVVEFDDLDGLRQYLMDPAHNALARIFSEASSAIAYDFCFDPSADLGRRD